MSYFRWHKAEMFNWQGLKDDYRTQCDISSFSKEGKNA